MRAPLEGPLCNVRSPVSPVIKKLKGPTKYANIGLDSLVIRFIPRGGKKGGGVLGRVWGRGGFCLSARRVFILLLLLLLGLGFLVVNF